MYSVLMFASPVGGQSLLFPLVKVLNESLVLCPVSLSHTEKGLAKHALNFGSRYMCCIMMQPQ